LIKENIERIRENIKRAAKVSGRNPDDILLLAVTKTVDIDSMTCAYNLGINEFGENRVQELTKKYDIFKDSVKWHMIGNLQTNKVKYIADKVKLIHSLDSLKLAAEIDRCAKNCGRIIDVLVEINIANEQSKHGIRQECLDEFIQKVSIYKNISIKGLMTVAPFVENSQKNRIYFDKMRNLFVDIKNKNIDNINMLYLSMGMTNDYDVAVEEGANIIRVGTGIFGKRHYN
jgi:hypothetical protein